MAIFERILHPKRKTAGEKMGAARARELGLLELAAGLEEASWRPGSSQPADSLPDSPTEPPTDVAPAKADPPAVVSPGLGLLLEDILPRVPTRVIKAGFHDPTRELRFGADELTAGIARGRASVPLSRLAALCPDVFEAPAHPGEDLPVPLPLQKLMQQLAHPASSRVAAAAAESNGAAAEIKEPAPAPIVAPEPEQSAETPVVDPAPDDASAVGASPEPPPAADFSADPPSPPTPLESSEAGAAPVLEAPVADPPRNHNAPPPEVPRFAASIPMVRPPDVQAGSDEAPTGTSVLFPNSPPEDRPAPVPPSASGPVTLILPPPMARPSFLPPPLFGKAPPVSIAPLHSELAAIPAAPAKPELAIPQIPFARFDQSRLQRLFMTDELLDLPKICALIAELPSIEGCTIAVAEKVVQRGEWPAELDPAAVQAIERGLAKTTVAFGATLPRVQTITLFGEDRAISFFAGREVSMCVAHSARGFLPGVREKLAAAADALAEGFFEPEKST